MDCALEQVPSAGGQVDRDGRYPLHFAMCSHDAGKKYAGFVSRLISEAPQAVEAADKHGRLPLHYAYWREASDEVISAVKEAGPGTEGMFDKAGKTPVRAPASSSASSCQQRLSGEDL